MEVHTSPLATLEDPISRICKATVALVTPHHGQLLPPPFLAQHTPDRPPQAGPLAVEEPVHRPRIVEGRSQPEPGRTVVPPSPRRCVGLRIHSSQRQQLPRVTVAAAISSRPAVVLVVPLQKLQPYTCQELAHLGVRLRSQAVVGP